VTFVETAAMSSSFRIPEGSTVELAVGAGPRPDPGVRLAARGKVLRVQPKASGDFAIAIECDRAFEPMREDPLTLGELLFEPSMVRSKRRIAKAHIPSPCESRCAR
jgi:hypothetical protein